MNNPVRNSLKRTINLRPIGRKELSLGQLKKIGAKIKNKAKQAMALQKKASQLETGRAYDYYKQQVEPEQSLNQQDKLQKSKILKKIKDSFSKMEDPNHSIFLYQKVSIIEHFIFILTIFTFWISVVDTEIGKQFAQSEQLGRLKLRILLLQSGCTGVLGLIVVVRYLAIFQIEVQQRKRYVLRYSQSEWRTVMTDFVRSGDELVWLLLLELLVILPHPFASFVDYKVLIFQPVNEVYIQHDLNDILSILMLMRVYIIFRSLISKTIYATPRSSRLCYNNGIDHSFLYCVKCILHQNPIIAIGTAEAIMVLILGYALKLSQGTLPDTQDVTPTGFQSFGNCFWIVFVTMGTIGYGDYYPKTVLGRSITVIAAIAGVILSSLLIVALSEYLNLQSNQSKSHITLTRLFQQTKLKQEAKDSLAQTLKVSVFLNQSQNNQTYSSQPELAKIREEEKKKELKNLFDKLKKKIDKTKTRTKQIKNIVDTDNVAEQMNRMFQIFKDCLKEAYQNQMKLKHCFDSLQKQQSEKQHLVIRKTFAQEMQNIMEAL